MRAGRRRRVRLGPVTPSLYLDATSERNKRLYERHGFEAEAEYAPEGGPPLWPMWREPKEACRRLRP